MKINISGIRCDNLKCDFVEENVFINEYHLWIDKLCPKCNSTLLTKKDFEVISNLLSLNDLKVNN